VLTLLISDKLNGNAEQVNVLLSPGVYKV